MGHSAPRTGTTNLPRPTGQCGEIAPSRSRSANHSKFRANYQDSGGRRAVGGRRRDILKGGPNISEIYFSLSPRQGTHHTYTHTPTPTRRSCETLFYSFSTRCLSVPKSSWLWADKILEPRVHCEVFYLCLGERYPLKWATTVVFLFFSLSYRWGISKEGGRGGGRERMGWRAFQYPLFSCLRCTCIFWSFYVHSLFILIIYLLLAFANGRATVSLICLERFLRDLFFFLSLPSFERRKLVEAF